MFETDFIRWLQTFDAPWLLAAMRAISELGTASFYTIAFVLLAFGVRLKPMLGVLLAMLIAGAATDAFKQGHALPRPSEVDARVLDKGEAGHHVVADGAADGFWALPSEEAISAVRATGERDYGFVSGHSSAAVAFAIGLVLFFGLRVRPWWWLAIGWALAMGVSRMYLGRHFPADVLGGWTVGVLAVLASWAFTRAIAHADAARRRMAWTLAFLVTGTALGLSFAWPAIDPSAVGAIAGTLACIALLPRLGPERERGPWQRVAAVVLGFVTVYGVTYLLAIVGEAGGWPERHPVGFLFAALGFPLAILGGAWLSRALGRPPSPSATSG